MGAETRRNKSPLLQTPAQSSIRSPKLPKDDATNTDLATDLSQRTEKSSFSIPEDGSPVIINTKRRSGNAASDAQSQTSLLIEYFEAGKGPNLNSRPSVRVKVTPSSSSKDKGATQDHVPVTESIGDTQPSYTRRITLGPLSTGTHVIGNTERDPLASELSASPRPRAALDLESLDRDSASEMTSTSLSNQNQYSNLNPSEISSMPPDSVLESATEAPTTPKRTGGGGASKDEMATTRANLTAPVERGGSVSKERLTRKVIEKLGQEAALGSGSGKERSGKIRSRSVSKEHLEDPSSSPRRRSGKHRALKDDAASSDPSLLTASQISDGRSIRSGASKSSINNPKLLETVEDAIRRLILPELNALKAEQKTQKNREKFEGGRRESGSSGSRDESGRKLSKHSSDPSVRAKQKGAGDVYKHPSEKGLSDETVVRDSEKPRRRRSKDSHRLRDATTGALVAGVLTREALKHHDSQSSVERRERRRKRSKSHSSRSHSRHDSVPESEDAFQKHDVPPMPMQSEATGSDMTRDSILSGRTSTPTSERRRTEIRQAARGGSLDASSPTKASRGFQEVSQPNQYYHDDGDYHDTGSYENNHQYRDLAGVGLAGAAAGLGAAALVNTGGVHYYEDYSHPYGGGHTLSPIQSVASLEEAETEHHKASLQHRAHSAGSLDSLKHRGKLDVQNSTETFSSTEDMKAIANRPRGISLESPSEILRPHSFKTSDPNLNRTEDNRYRDSIRDQSLEESTRDPKHLSNYTDDSLDGQYHDKTTVAQQIRAIGANPEYIEGPVAVESAVASLYEPSMVDVNSNQSSRSRAGERAQSEPLGSDDQYDHLRYEEHDRPASTSNLGSPLKNQVMQHDLENTRELAAEDESPRQSAASPTKDASQMPYGYDEQVQLSHSGLPDSNDPMPEIGQYASKSDISTNPSIIQGPGGGLSKDQTPWMYDQAHEQMGSGKTSHDTVKAAAKNLLAAAAGAGAGATFANRAQKGLDSEENDFSKEAPLSYGTTDQYRQTGQKFQQASPIPRDEGYETGVPAHSPSLTPDHRGKAAPILFSNEEDDGGIFGVTDYPTMDKSRALSADSHGAGSPLYDSATGNGMDNIQSKDIVALMNHLTVRDAQRNARDTEILVTMVQIATELRTSFADMRKFIQDQDNMVIEVGNKQHDKTQRVIGGPRPQPPSSTRLARASSEEGDDAPTKRRNVFRRALRNLSGKNNDMTKVEDMLNHLLEEVADLKIAQGLEINQFQHKGILTDGLTSYEALRDGQQSGYEPEGRAGTSSNADNSGFFSNASSQQTARPQSFGRRRTSENRISTVMEADEEGEDHLEPHEQQVLNYHNDDALLTPTRAARVVSNVPETPTAAAPIQGAGSNENTPRTDKSKKHHKSSSSSFFPKISRWSKTTASSVAENVRNSARKERPYSNVSHSGSDLHNFDVTQTYDPQGDDRIRSNTSLNQDRPPSPLVPSSVSEKPTYRAHRDSLNLQHPQPRPGPTARYQNQLESQAMAQNVSPISPSSDHFGSNPILARYSGASGNRTSGNSYLTPNSNNGIAETANSQAPPRPPKIRDEGPLIPAKIPLDDNKKPIFAERSAPVTENAETSGPRRSFSGQTPPQGKPSGPRPIVSSGSYTPDRVTAQPRTRYRGTPNPIDSSSEDVTF